MAYFDRIKLSGEKLNLFSEFFKNKEKARVVKRSTEQKKSEKKKGFSVWKMLENEIVVDD